MAPKLPVDIETLGKEPFAEWLNSFDVVLSDCDGVIWLHDTLFEGSNDAINKFVDMGKKVYLITNNNQTVREEMAEKCKKMNFNLGLEQMISSSHTTAQYMKEIQFNKKAYVIGSQALVNELEAVGVGCTGFGPDVIDDELAPHVYKTLKTMDPEVGAVVVGFDQHFSFPKLFKAVNYLRNPEVKLIGTNDDNKVDFPNFTFPDAGPILAAIENATGRKAEVMGKPSTFLTKVGLKHELHRDSNRFLMIGDRLNTDILFGKRNKFQTLLVGTGIHQLTDVKEVIDKIDRGEGDHETELHIPDFYISGLKNLFKN